jgi:hypothetical protein
MAGTGRFSRAATFSIVITRHRLGRNAPPPVVEQDRFYS